MLDASIIPAGQDETTIVVFRNGVAIPNCTSPGSGIANPDPCVYSRQKLLTGDIALGVYTSAASHWNFAPALHYAFSGFSLVVVNPPTINVMKAGSAVTVVFGLGGNQGTNIFAAGSPSSAPVSCSAGPTRTVPLTVEATKSSLYYVPLVRQYIYVWKTDKTWAQTCRQLVVKLADGTSHYANFKFTK